MLYFKEEQKMNQWWVVLVLVGVDLMILGIFIPGIYEQLILGEPWGDIPMSDPGLILVSAFTFLVLGGVSALLLSAKLETQIDKYSIRYRYFPFIRSWRKVSFDELQEFHVRKYSPISEYGGWGYRFRGRKNIALNTRGNMGLQLIFKDHKKLLIGTQKPDQLKALISKIQENKQENYG
ncbi:MAG: hypothetical protein AAGF85_10800 [Bacteroidota bacterium]